MKYVVARTEETSEHPSRMLILGEDLLADVQAAVGRLHVLATLAGVCALEPAAISLH
jgi:hypothetical protein